MPASDSSAAAPPPAAAPSRAHPGGDGYVDYFGYAAAAGGWLFCGWTREIWPDDEPAVEVEAQFQSDRIAAGALTCFFQRPDLKGRGQGLIVFVRSSGRSLGEFLGLEIKVPGSEVVLRLPAVRPIEHLREAELVQRARATLLGGSGAARSRLLGLLGRQVFSGVDTLDQLPVPVMMEVDETVLAPPDGLMLMGWLLDPTGSVASVRVRSGSAASPPVGERWLRTGRQDVVEAFGARFGLSDARCGFLAFAPDCVEAGEQLYAEIELHDGKIGYKRLPSPVRRGVAAMRRVLESVALAPDEIESAFDRVLGPPLVAINDARLGQPRPRSEVVFGEPNPRPECSVIVPLYGRMDFLTYQLALLSQADVARHEFIYVLDDPPRKRELLGLAQSAHQRFGVPFRVVALEENLGFAPANNVGLEHARGEFTCYLNSDVMPDEPRWLDLILDGLRADPGIGLAGALLLFEDGTVQHEGMVYERLPEHGGWPFPMHPNKGRLPAPGPDLAEVEAVTGACMVLRTDLARELGGFDEVYAVGDFEDSDLCFKVKRKGLRCVVDRRARLWHLERQSQVTPDNVWRYHLTLQNAWVHTRRWFGETAVVQLAQGACPSPALAES